MDNPPSKWDQCKHRSEDKVDKEILTCCGKAKVNGFICYKRDIIDIKPRTCATCTKFENK